MRRDPCATCFAHCCGGLPEVRPVLFPWEDAAQYCHELRRGLRLVQRGPSGLCVYYSTGRQQQGRGGCTIYRRRPLECRLYPLVVEPASRFNAHVHLDQRATCVHSGDAKLLAALDRHATLPPLVTLLTQLQQSDPQWIAAYLHGLG